MQNSAGRSSGGLSLILGEASKPRAHASPGLRGGFSRRYLTPSFYAYDISVSISRVEVWHQSWIVRPLGSNPWAQL